MKTSFLFLALFATLTLTAQTQRWAAHVPPFGDTIGVWDIEVVNENIIWAVGLRTGASEAHYAVTADGGTTWKTGVLPMTAVHSMAATDAGTALVIGFGNSGAETIKTTDGGTTWQVTPNNWEPVASFPDYIYDYSPARMTVIGDPRDGEFEIYNTINAGLIWNRVPGANIPDPLSGEFGYNNSGAATENTIWFATNQGRVFRSQNGGVNWEAFTTPLGSSLAGIAFSDANNGVVTTGYGLTTMARMAITTDGGVTWAELANQPYAGGY